MYQLFPPPISASLRLCGLIVLLSLSLYAQAKDYTRYVNPFIGTGGHGHTFPGATMPFGMVQLSPDTRRDNWDGSSGYHYSDDIIYGFSHTHLSGTGIPDYCDILFMPTIGKPVFEAKAGEKDVNGYASKFSHANEKAEPGYYSVKLDDDNILAEMTATPRVGLHRYTFPSGGKANIVLNLEWRDKVLDSSYTVTPGAARIEGFRRSSSWAKDQVIYFVAEFSKTIESVSFSATGGIPLKGNWKTSLTPPPDITKGVFTFKTKPGEHILLKVAISPVSIEGARKNLEAELPGWDFEKVRADAKAAWNKELSKIEVSGGTPEQTTNFYTALYHTAIQPNIFQDVDGQYRGHDGKVHTAPKDTHYTVFSLWDTFRAAHPLYTITNQKRTVDFINTFIRQYEQGGRLPVWELAGEETDTMIGYHAVSVIADAMVKGIKGFDYEKAYQAAKHSAELDHFGLAAYKRRGFISMEDEQESVSKTLEYAYNDWCIAQMANVLEIQRIKIVSVPGPTFADKSYQEDREKYMARGRYFENLFDPTTDFMRPRQNGGFVKPFQPNEVTFHFTEGNSWQYTFFVPHDVSRLIDLMGGSQKFSAKLDELFTTEVKLSGREQPDITGMIGQYAHGNEPSHHIAYLYNHAGEPWKTQKMVRRIMDEFYKPAPDGLIGNEDCGQMSAWYVLSASGFYPVAPGEINYDLGTPIFKKIKYHLENGKTFTINAPNVSPENFYIKSVKLNAKPFYALSIPHWEIMKGGTLEFEMAAEPQKATLRLLPRSDRLLMDESPSVPLIDGGGRVFEGQATVSMTTTTPGAGIFYTTDGTEPNERSTKYSGPFAIDKTSTIRATAILEKGGKSLTAEARFFKKPNDWTVQIADRYNRQYTGGGDEGLIDGIRGTLNWASGEWQGYQPKDLLAVIDLQREMEIKRVGGGFLQDARPWIWMPTRIVFEVSSDKINFMKVAEIKTDIDPTDMKAVIRDYKQDISPVRARYVRVRAYNLGKIPAWHPGAGDDAFIFVDEIFIE